MPSKKPPLSSIVWGFVLLVSAHDLGNCSHKVYIEAEEKYVLPVALLPTRRVYQQGGGQVDGVEAPQGVPFGQASKPPPIGPRAKPAEVAEKAMPKAAPCRSGGVRTVARARSSGTATFLAKSGDMEAYPVGRVVKSLKNDGERCIESVA